MATKYMLATELRELTRGMKALPICKMTKAQLETEIDRIKALKAIEVAQHPPARPGPLGPRSIDSTHVTSGDATITVPIAPKARMTGKPRPMRVSEKVTVSFDDTDPIMDLLTPAAKADVISHTTMTARERPTPTMSLPSRPGTSAGRKEYANPGAPKLSDAPVHKCNCPRCPGSLA